MKTKKNGKLLEIEFNRDKKPVLYVKTCAEYEEYLKSTKEVATADNLFNAGKEAEFYDGKLFLYPDSVRRDLFENGSLNHGILRLKGIADGVEIDLSKAGLIAVDTIESEMRKLISNFRDFYKTHISRVRIKGVLEVVDV